MSKLTITNNAIGDINTTFNSKPVDHSQPPQDLTVKSDTPPTSSDIAIVKNSTSSNSSSSSSTPLNSLRENLSAIGLQIVNSPNAETPSSPQFNTTNLGDLEDMVVLTTDVEAKRQNVEKSSFAHQVGHPSNGNNKNLGNQHEVAGFRIGFSEERNKRYRRTMEDAHSYFYNFANVKGQGWFAVYDGHAGKTVADWCGSHLHENFNTLLATHPTLTIPETLNQTFLMTDNQLAVKGMKAGCTAIVAFIRTEERGEPFDDTENNMSIDSDMGVKSDKMDQDENTEKTKKRKRVLYTANVGDARAVLCRNGTAIRLSYDHKGSDSREAQRIVESGGVVMNNRVNGVLAVTRSLGDISMKELIIGNPFTTETVLQETDTFLILACDGVWDVCSDQTAVDIIKDIDDPQEASETLMAYALDNQSQDNLSVLVIRMETSWEIDNK
ncbi:Protein phosphatase 2C 1 [Nowakowskiella sp. JEL0407]|nr:Protein phosphatase 2C 1 [Nowakowskiella sp. JEL0407]